MAKETASGPGSAGGGFPEPSFTLLLAGIAAQGQVSLGLMPNPLTKETKQDLAQARHAIGLIEMLEVKTKGNLDDAERRLLNEVIHGLRMAYIAAVK